MTPTRFTLPAPDETSDQTPEQSEGGRRGFDLHLHLDDNQLEVELDGSIGITHVGAVEAGLMLAASYAPVDTTIALRRVEHMDAYAVGLLCGFADRNAKVGGETRLVGARGRLGRKLERVAARGKLRALIER